MRQLDDPTDYLDALHDEYVRGDVSFTDADVPYDKSITEIAGRPVTMSFNYNCNEKTPMRVMELFSYLRRDDESKRLLKPMLDFALDDFIENHVIGGAPVNHADDRPMPTSMRPVNAQNAYTSPVIVDDVSPLLAKLDDMARRINAMSETSGRTREDINAMLAKADVQAEGMARIAKKLEGMPDVTSDDTDAGSLDETMLGITDATISQDDANDVDVMGERLDELRKRLWDVTSRLGSIEKTLTTLRSESADTNAKVDSMSEPMADANGAITEMRQTLIPQLDKHIADANAVTMAVINQIQQQTPSIPSNMTIDLRDNAQMMTLLTNLGMVLERQGTTLNSVRSMQGALSSHVNKTDALEIEIGTLLDEVQELSDFLYGYGSEEAEGGDEFEPAREDFGGGTTPNEPGDDAVSAYLSDGDETEDVGTDTMVKQGERRRAVTSDVDFARFGRTDVDSDDNGDDDDADSTSRFANDSEMFDLDDENGDMIPDAEQSDDDDVLDVKAYFEEVMSDIDLPDSDADDGTLNGNVIPTQDKDGDDEFLDDISSLISQEQHDDSSLVDQTISDDSHASDVIATQMSDEKEADDAPVDDELLMTLSKPVEDGQIASHNDIIRDTAQTGEQTVQADVIATDTVAGISAPVENSQSGISMTELLNVLDTSKQTEDDDMPDDTNDGFMTHGGYDLYETDGIKADVDSGLLAEEANDGSDAPDTLAESVPYFANDDIGMFDDSDDLDDWEFADDDNPIDMQEDTASDADFQQEADEYADEIVIPSPQPTVEEESEIVIPKPQPIGRSATRRKNRGQWL